MASPSEGDQTVPDGESEEEATNIRSIQSHYLRCPSPSSLSLISESRFSMISGSDAESIYMEPIHLSSAIAAKQIINEELPQRGIRAESTPDSMLETAEQLMVEDLYNRVKDMIDDRSPYNTPCVMDIQRAMVQDRLEAPNNTVDEVWKNIFIAEKSVAVNKARLKRMGITHILNAAHGTGVYTGEAFYAGMNIGYMGIEVDDFAESDISPHFRSCAEFLDEALLTHKGKVLVSSMMGESRSAVLVAAYLMIFQHMTIMEALTALRKKRPINPNEGFLKQLRQFNEMLLEERDDDDDDTLSQCSVIDAHTRAHLFDDEESMMGVKAHSIMMEEEEDSQSVMSSVASSAAAAALRAGVFGGQRMGLEQAKTTEGLVLPGKDGGDCGEDGEDGDEDGMSMIREWQRRNEKYQSEEWWEQQLMSEAGDEESLLGGMRGPEAPGDEDLESVTSEDVQAMKERLKRRPRRTPSDSVSTASCSSFSDLWKQRLKEIEEQAAARYRKKDDDNDSESTATEGTEKKKKTMEDDVESVLSDTSSMYNFCKRNKENLTPLERWRVKRIQFGWNKNDEGREGEKRDRGAGGSGEQGEGDAEAHTPAVEDVNLTAYQTWKMKQAKRLGEDNKATKDDIVEMSRGEDSATAKRRQRREDLLERSRKTLEESQSMCGWETESSISGSTLPLSAFFTQPGGSQARSVANDDNVSMLSGRSSVSQARSTRSQASMGQGIPQGIPQVPMIPMPTMQGPGGEPMVDLSSIQNWIANVVSETLIQKEREMSLPPSQAGSVLSFGGASSVVGPARRGLNDDKASMLSGASYSSSLAHHGVGADRAESVLSGRSAASSTSNLSSVSGLGSRRSKITTTSVPLYSLFADQVNLQKLDSMDKQMQSEMRNKMASYGVKKIAEDNKRSTLYKKKKPKDEEEEEKEDDYLTGKTKTSLPPAPEKKKAPVRSYGLSGCLNLSTALEKGKNTSVDEWLTNVMPPSRKPASYSAEDEADPGPSASEYNFGGRRDSFEEEEEEEYEVASRYRSRFQADTESHVLGKFSSNGMDSSNYRARRSYATTEEEEEEEESYTSKRKFTHHSQYESVGETEGRIGRKEEEEEEEDVDNFLSQLRQRSRARAEAEMQDDDVVAAWRAQQESKSNGYKSSDS